MATKDYNAEEKQMDTAAQHSPNGSADEKHVFDHKEAVHKATAHEAAEQGHAATDQ
jgi:hypothetical protein